MQAGFSFVEKVMQKSPKPIHLIKCKDVNGRKCYYVIMCTNAKLKMIMEAEEDIHDLGEEGYLIASGFGHEVPASVRKMLKEKYNFAVES